MINLTDEMKEAIASAYEDRLIMISASVDEDGQPGIAYFASAQVHSDHQLAVWMRTPNPETGLLRRIAANPKVSFLYRNPAKRLAWQFHGEARRDDDEEVRSKVRAATPENERERDAEGTGVAVIIDIVRVISGGEVIMER